MNPLLMDWKFENILALSFALVHNLMMAIFERVREIALMPA